ncbi:MAG: 50S ribosomal protein L24 [Chloroflexi bacterium]|nr:50S ribosomal protein L24 [Chloroflexota bacterium]
MQRIKKGDTVEITAGKDKGVRGQVLVVEPKKDRVMVAGANIVKKHEKARQAGTRQVPAQIVEAENPLHLSNVMLVCPECEKAVRVGFRVREDGRKVRVCKKCSAEIE